MNDENWFFQMPEGEIGILDILFGIPNQWTGGMYINMILVGFYGTFFIATMYQQDRPNLQDAAMYASFGTFMTTLGLVLLSTYTNSTIAGENQLIPMAVILIGSILWSYLSTGGNTL